MKDDLKNAWKKEPWTVHPDVPHAIMIPGYGFYGGLPEDVAAAIVAQMNVMRAKTSVQVAGNVNA